MTTYSTISQYTKATAKKVSAYLGPLLDHALQFVPRKKIEETPLFVLATGGMRRLKQQPYDEFAIPRAAIIDCISLGNFSIRRMIPSPGMTKGFTDGWRECAVRGDPRTRGLQQIDGASEGGEDCKQGLQSLCEDVARARREFGMEASRVEASRERIHHTT